MQPCNRIYYSTVHWRLNMFQAVCRSKHVEPSMNGGIINSVTRFHLVGYFCWVILFTLCRLDNGGAVTGHSAWKWITLSDTQSCLCCTCIFVNSFVVVSYFFVYSLESFLWFLSFIFGPMFADVLVGLYRRTVNMFWVHIFAQRLVFFNPLNAKLNPICYLLALLAHHFLHVSRIRVNLWKPTGHVMHQQV